MKMIRLQERMIVVRCCGECPMMKEFIRAREVYPGDIFTCGIAPIYITDKTKCHIGCPLERCIG
jgi:hypothetical protein